MAEGEGSKMMLTQNNTGNQISRYDKENINAEKSTRQQARLQMKQENGEHCYGSQTINVCPVLTLYGCWMMHGYLSEKEHSIASASRGILVVITVLISKKTLRMDEYFRAL